MIRNNHYKLKRISNIPYLLPVGQLIADQRRGIMLNETGVYLWKLLKKDHSMEELISACAEYYSFPSSELSTLNEDIQQFVTTLSMHGMIISSDSCKEIKSPFYKCIEIAGLKCNFFGPAETFPPQLNAFSTNQAAQFPQQNIEILSAPPTIHENGKLLLRNEELAIIEATDKYILLFPTFEQITEVHLAKDASVARFYCTPPFTDFFRQSLFHALRQVYLYLALKHDMLVIHSASILYKDKAWLFSASSGTGKSTHANLWNTIYQTPIINGDLNLIAIHNKKALIHGLPWCGTSDISDPKTYPLGGIILLKQADSDYVLPLSADQKRLFVLQRLVSPSWNGSFLDTHLRIVNALASKILICRLFCTPNASAVEAVKQEIDHFEKKKR